MLYSDTKFVKHSTAERDQRLTFDRIQLGSKSITVEEFLQDPLNQQKEA